MGRLAYKGRLEFCILHILIPYCLSKHIAGKFHLLFLVYKICLEFLEECRRFIVYILVYDHCLFRSTDHAVVKGFRYYDVIYSLLHVCTLIYIGRDVSCPYAHGWLSTAVGSLYHCVSTSCENGCHAIVMDEGCRSLHTWMLDPLDTILWSSCCHCCITNDYCCSF